MTSTTFWVCILVCLFFFLAFFLSFFGFCVNVLLKEWMRTTGYFTIICHVNRWFQNLLSMFPAHTSVIFRGYYSCWANQTLLSKLARQHRNVFYKTQIRRKQIKARDPERESNVTVNRFTVSNSNFAASLRKRPGRPKTIWTYHHDEKILDEWAIEVHHLSW